jgi:hypothetical protein
MPKYRRRRPEEREKFIVPLNQERKRRDPEVLPWYWHPDRMGIERPPAAFDAQLKAIDKDLFVTYSKVHERWILWVRNARIQHPMCRGWQLLMIWEHAYTKEFLPLTELMFHNIFMISASRFPNAVKYYEDIQAGIEKRKQELQKDADNDRRALQSELLAGTQISSAGKGNKFALHHDGSVMPSLGELAWRKENRATRLPSDMLKQERDDKEREFYGR